jgi:hypothetical protein
MELHNSPTEEIMRFYTTRPLKSSLLIVLSVSLMASQLTFARVENCLPKTANVLSIFGGALGGLVAVGGFMYLTDIPVFDYHCDADSEYGTLLQIGEYEHCSDCGDSTDGMPMCAEWICKVPQFLCQNDHNQTIVAQRNVDQIFLLTAVATGAAVILGVIGCVGACATCNAWSAPAGYVELPHAA